jgi:hypothetical protein
MEAKRVRYFLLSTYRIGDWRFGKTYMETLGKWLETRCRVVARFRSPEYGVTVYETPFGAPSAARPVSSGGTSGM